MRCSVDTSLQVYVGLKKVILPRKNQDEKCFNNKKKHKKSTRPNITSNSFCNNCQLALISELWAYAIVLTIFPTQIYIRRGCLICFTQEYRPSHIFFLRGIYDPLRLAIFCKKKLGSSRIHDFLPDARK